MLRSRCGRTFVAFALALALPVSWAHAAGRSRALAPRAVESQPAAPLQFLVSLWGALTSVWGDAGCEADPNGRCTPASPAVGTGGPTSPEDAGCELDPLWSDCLLSGSPGWYELAGQEQAEHEG